MQELGCITFISPIMIPQIYVTTLNRSSITDYLLLDEKTILFNKQKSLLSIDFQSEVKIGGNIFTDRNSNTMLDKISDEAIGRTENAQIISSDTIIFKEYLLANHITMRMNKNKFIQQSNGFGKFARKRFLNMLFAYNNVTVSDLEVRIFNQILLSIQMNLIMEIGLNSNLSTALIFEKQISASMIMLRMDSNLVDNSNHPESYFDLNKIALEIFHVQNHQIGSLIIDGIVWFNYTADKDYKVYVCNGFEFFNYLNVVILKGQQNHQKSIEVGGEKTFVSEFFASNVRPIEFNKRIQIREWIENAFRQQRHETKGQQIIEGSMWQFIDLITDNFQTEQLVNGIETLSANSKIASIIFVNDDLRKKVLISSDISFSNYLKFGEQSNLKCTKLRPCNIQNFVSDTVYLSQIIWYELNITGNVQVVEARGTCGLLCFFQRSLSAKLDQNINWNITLKLKRRDKFLINRIMSLPMDQQVAFLVVNNIEITKIFNDAVLQTVRYPFDRSITFEGKKKLIGIKISCDGIETFLSAEFSVSSINDINMRSLNETIFFQNYEKISIFSGQRLIFLETPIMRAIYAKKINGIFVANLIFLYTTHLNQISSISFQKLINFSANFVVSHERIDVGSINGISLKFLIDNRSKIYSRIPASAYSIMTPQFIEELLTFEKLILEGNVIKIDQINDIRCEDTILTYSKEKQHVTGYKRIVGTSPFLNIEKPFHTWKINSLEFISVYAKTVSTNREHSFERYANRKPYNLDAQNSLTVRKFNEISLSG